MSSPVKYAAGLTLSITPRPDGYALLAKGEKVVYLHNQRATTEAELAPMLTVLAAVLESPADLDNDLWTRFNRLRCK